MATYQVMYWQEIPSQVEAKGQDGKVAKQMLSHRFQELIDIIAAKRKLDSSDDYIGQWNRGKKIEKPGSVDQVVSVVVAELEEQFVEIKAKALAQSTHAKT